MKRFFVCILILFCMKLHSTIYRLHDLINHGINNSTEVRNAQNSILNLEDSHRNFQLDWIPSANISLSYSHMNRFNTPTIEQLSSNEGLYSTGLSLGQSIALNEPKYFNLRRSNINLQIANNNLKSIKKKVALDIVSAFIDIKQQERSINITEENQKLQVRLYEQTLIQFRTHSKTIFDLQQTQIDTLDTHIQLLDMRNQLNRQRENLFFLLKLEDQGFPFEDFDFKIQDIEIDLNSITNFNIKNSELRLISSRSQLNQQYLGYFPHLTLGYNWGTSHSQKDFSSSLFQFDKFNTSGTFSFNLSYPLLNQFRQSLNYRTSRRNFSMEELSHQEMVYKTNQDIRQMINELTRLRQIYDLNVQKHELTRRTLQIAEQRYILGNISNLDLDRARIQYLNAEIQLNTRFYTIIRRQEDLNFLTSGKILGEW